MTKIYIACDSYSYAGDHVAMSTSKENIMNFIEKQVAEGEFEDGQLKILVVNVSDEVIVLSD